MFDSKMILTLFHFKLRWHSARGAAINFSCQTSPSELHITKLVWCNKLFVLMHFCQWATLLHTKPKPENTFRFSGSSLNLHFAHIKRMNRNFNGQRISAKIQMKLINEKWHKYFHPQAKHKKYRLISTSLPVRCLLASQKGFWSNSLSRNYLVFSCCLSFKSFKLLITCKELSRFKFVTKWCVTTGVLGDCAPNCL